MDIQPTQDLAQVYSLRSVTAEDHPWLVDLHNDPVVLRNVTDPSPITIEHHLRWWGSLNPERELRLIFTMNGVAAGFAKFYQIDRINKTCQLGGDLQVGYRGRRLAEPMWSLMLDYAFCTLDLYRVGLSTAAYNHVAQRVYQKLGFRVEGAHVKSLLRDGQRHDEILMYMLKEDWK